ncbi:hypothetical protein E8E12_001799 [Didymella heteroderae]|uniref:Uncharacterized protein n=1 Tax=Didymella heteroderae TaxID=1769908 RepID=A0A9P4WHX0_9PLEO|nr:hypothetical protein E8E12_001799 [Didymella heteroderae]
MVTTRRQSKTIDPPALPPVALPKRKRSDDATPAQSAAQAPNQPSTKRRKKVKSTAKIASLAAAPANPVPPAETEKNALSKTAKRNARKQRVQSKTITPSGRSGTTPSSWQRPIPLDLTNNESEDDAPRPPRPAASQGADDEDADSRYTIGSKRKGKLGKPAVPTARRTAELQFEEDGVAEVDKAQVAVADASNRKSTQKKRKPRPLPCTSINERSVAKKDEADMPQASGKATGRNKEALFQVSANDKGKNCAAQRKAPPAGVPSKVIMFTIAEAIAALSLYKDGTMSMAAEIDPESRQPYAPLQTGEHLSYPVKGNYHLGALGRYGIDTASVPPFSLTVPLSEHSFIESTTVTSTAAPSRHGLGFTALPAQPKAPSVRRPNNYCFTFGRYRGRRVDSVPITYLRSIFEGDEYYADAKLQQAFADLYPKGLYESETESFVFEKGGFKGKRLDEVPKSYLWGLIRKKGEGVEIGGKKGRKALERALEVWEKKQLDLTKD